MSFFLLCLRDPSFTSGVLDWLHFWTILFCRSCGLIIQGKSRKQETRIVTTWGSDGRDGGVFLLSFNKLYLVDPVQLLLFPLFGESEDMKTKWEKIQKNPLSWSKPPVTLFMSAIIFIGSRHLFVENRSQQVIASTGHLWDSADFDAGDLVARKYMELIIW